VTKPPSLRWLLISRLVVAQAGLLTTLVLTFVCILWATGHLITLEPDDETIDAVRSAIARDAKGDIFVRETEALAKRKRESPELWYVVRDRANHQFVCGNVPAPFAHIGTALDDIGQARLGWTFGGPPRPNARMRWVETAAGSFQIVAGSAGRVSWTLVLRAVALILASIVVPVVVVMTLTTLFVIPLAVRRALSGLDRVADHAQSIEVNNRDARLPTEQVPAEVAPLVQAINDALQRIDDGYARHQRFLADAAHELRTPIAVLQTRIESLPPSDAVTRSLEDTQRLSTLADQLLDIERLKHSPKPNSEIDLVNIGRSITAEMAPLAIAAGYDIAFESQLAKCVILGDGSAIGRALTNLVQNAIDHGGRRGQILVFVELPASVSVLDQGPGIAPQEQHRVFEPFYRGSQAGGERGGRGAGLGLNLVQEVVRLHGGNIEVCNRPGAGACIKIIFQG
jgi:signal transduction histidine kinase